jgi:hypothetical protein
MRTISTTGVIAGVLIASTLVLAVSGTASADRECSVATVPEVPLVTCAEAQGGLNGHYDEACECWTEVRLNAIGNHDSLVPANGTVKAVYDGEVVASDYCLILQPGDSCTSRAFADMQGLPSGFCFDIVAQTVPLQDAVGGVEDRETFCSPL